MIEIKVYLDVFSLYILAEKKSIGIASNNGEVKSFRCQFDGNRTEVRMKTCNEALRLLCEFVKGIN